MTNKVLVTGGAGFLGSHLCDALLAEGSEVICVDNFLSGSRDNIKHLTDNPKFQLIEHDVINHLPSSIDHLALSAIFHFASPASPNPKSEISYMAHPIETLTVNSQGTQHMLELATQNDCQIVLASTSEVYGDPEVHPQPEEYWGHVSPNGPRSCYDEAKRYLEAISFAYHRTRGTKIKVVRIFNTYGPRMILDEGRLIPALINSYLTNQPFLLHGDGSSSRSFCYVSDLIAGITAVAHTDQAVGEVINLGNPDEYTITETIKVLEDLTGQKLAVQETSPLPDDPRRRRPDIAKARKLLGWEPAINLREGLKLMIKSYNHL